MWKQGEMVMMYKELKEFYKGKKVLVTGHTGFKGSWLSIWLNELGAEVLGYALESEKACDNFYLTHLEKHVHHIIGDIRDHEKLSHAFEEFKPDIVFHLAAQPLVRRGYMNPYYTYDVNVMGTLNVLECIRETITCKLGVVITSDKCYRNKEWDYGYRENDELGGKDIYSSSKSCAEILVTSYRDTYFSLDSYGDRHDTILITARAGNVIGGGDWAEDRIIPDCIRSLQEGNAIEIRNPIAVRPWQHVLEPLYGYLLLGMKGYDNGVRYSSGWNLGPDHGNCIPVKALVEKVIDLWGIGSYNQLQPTHEIKESTLLKLDSTKAKTYLGWHPRWDIHDTLRETVHWYKCYKDADVYELCCKQIHAYVNS